MKDIAKILVYGGLFLVPFLVLIVQNEYFFPYITGKNFTFRIIVEVMFAAWVVLACYDVQYRPKSSWIFAGLGALLATMAVSNALSPSPASSFWSNFERMEGYVTLVHVVAYFLVTASVLTTDKLWNRYLAVNVLVASLVSLIAFAQVGGFAEHRYGGFRADATLGNATYMAVYMLFSAFTALLLAARVSSRNWRYALIFLSVLFMWMVVQTATRGTTLGLLFGLLVTSIFVAFHEGKMRTIALGGLIAVAVLVGAFVAVRETSFVQENPVFQRLASISLGEGNVRFKVWDMAYQGFAERPIFGWGQGNFSYVFNEHYDPSIYFAEAWYDRVHNIFFDWLIAGGIVGTLAYFSIYGAAVYYLIVVPWRTGTSSFSVAERGILVGLLAGYLLHNVFVFDNIVSYIFFGTVLAFMHTRIGTPIKAIVAWKTHPRVIEQVVTPVAAVLLAVTVYFVNVPSMLAAGDIIDAFRESDADKMIAAFDRALSRHSFANQEIREQFTRRAQEAIFGNALSEEEKQALIERVERELTLQIEEKPGDARAHVFAASFYRSLGGVHLDKAITELERARELSPKKQQIIFEQGLVYVQKQDYARAHEYFKEAYELDTTYGEARTFYAMTAAAIGDTALLETLIESDAARDAFSSSDLALQVIYATKNYPVVREIIEYRIMKNPNDAQLRANLAYVLNESGDTKGAIESLTKAGAELPDFKAQAEQFITQIKEAEQAKKKGE